MPLHIRKILEQGAKSTVVNKISRDGQLLRARVVGNETRGVIPVLAQLCAQDPEVSRAYLCHPDVTSVFKLPKEGGFCGFVLPCLQTTCQHGITEIATEIYRR